MEKKHSIYFVTFLLAWVAGYCDTATFIAGDNIFSAHVTGNFITFAAQVATGNSEGGWAKLFTFPVFVIAVITGGRLASKSKSKYKILLAESILLIVSGTFGLLFPYIQMSDETVCIYTVVMFAVFAMGMQNAFGKLYAKETYGPTTMMTGNVTQASLDLGKILTNGIKNAIESAGSLRKQLITIGGFLVGCLLGALLGKLYGLAVIGLPGIALLICYVTGDKGIDETKAAP